MILFRIDPFSVSGLKEMQSDIEKTMQSIAHESAERLKNKIERNIREGYVGVPFGGGVWPWISESREKALARAGLLAGHTGLVAETEELINSLKVIETVDGGSRVSVDCEYAAAHEYGNPAENLPRRSFFWPAVSHFRAADIVKGIVNRAFKRLFRRLSK